MGSVSRIHLFALFAAVIGLVLLEATPATAQGRFQVIGEDLLLGDQGLRVLTVRDAHSSNCYALFMAEPTAVEALEPSTPVSTSANDAVEASVRRLREAAATRDRELTALRATPGISQAQLETGRLKIDADFEKALLAEVPGARPWASTTAGGKSGGQEETAEAIRRALLDPDPASARTLGNQFARIEALLTRLIEQPRLAVGGPFACTSAAGARR